MASIPQEVAEAHSSFPRYRQRAAIPSLFFYIFVFSLQLTVNFQYKFLMMTGFELQTSGIGSNRSTN